MDWLEQNLDAYRIIAEILNDLRDAFRDELESTHGKSWYKTALPEGLLDRLIEFKEKEKAIDWYESEYQQVTNYAVFPDLLDILEHNASTFPKIMQLAPTNALLHARFLELEVMRSKLGRARPISETELSFLGTFHLRFRKAMEDFRAKRPVEERDSDEEPAPQQPVTPPDTVAEQPVGDKTKRPRPEPVQQVKPPEPEAAEEPAAAAPAAVEQESAPAVVEAAVDETPAVSEVAEDTVPTPVPGPPRRPVQTPDGPMEVTDQPPAEEQVEKDKKDDDTPTAPGAAGESDEDPKSSAQALLEALDAGQDQIILRELYREITDMAEGIWTKEVPPTPSVWSAVCTSPWYETKFSSLGLKPLSDFYEILNKVDEQMRSGTSKEDLQEYLKDANFAQILLALRDMFQRNQI